MLVLRCLWGKGGYVGCCCVVTYGNVDFDSGRLRMVTLREEARNCFRTEGPRLPPA